MGGGRSGWESGGKHARTPDAGATRRPPRLSRQRLECGVFSTALPGTDTLQRSPGRSVTHILPRAFSPNLWVTDRAEPEPCGRWHGPSGLRPPRWPELKRDLFELRWQSEAPTPLSLGWSTIVLSAAGNLWLTHPWTLQRRPISIIRFARPTHAQKRCQRPFRALPPQSIRSRHSPGRSNSADLA